MDELTIWDAARLCGVSMPSVGRRSKCVFRQHKRKDKPLSVFMSRKGDVLFKCHSCDPPDNIGDAVALYAKLSGMSRRDAWKELRDRGYKVPGLKDHGARGGPRKAAPRDKPTPVRGRSPSSVLTLDLARWNGWQASELGAVERFAEARALSAEVLRAHDVVDIDARTIGFGYRDPYTAIPCRVKLRPLDRKAYWIEPRPPAGVQARALGPLYLADKLQHAAPGLTARAIITEGEPDALSLLSVGIGNVVSLPDGASSSKHVDLEPVSGGFSLWLVATDADEDGQAAYRALAARASRLGITSARVSFRKYGATHKDANEALQAGFVREDFIACLQDAASAALGYRVQVA